MRYLFKSSYLYLINNSIKRMSSTLITNPKYSFLKELGLSEVNQGVFNGSKWEANGKIVDSLNPATNEVIAQVKFGTIEDYNNTVEETQKAYSTWQDLPAPARGEIVRQIGDSLREQLQNLGKLVILILIK